MLKSKNLWITIPLVIVLCLLVAYQYGIKTIRSERDAVQESLSVQTELLKKYNALIAQKPAFEKRLKALKETRQSYGPRLVVGMTPPLAAARLQEAIKAAVTNRDGTVSSERVEKPEDRGNFQIISVSIDAVVPDTKALSDILYAIETSTPSLVIKKLDIRKKSSRRKKKTGVSSQLTVKLTVQSITKGS
jgi:hypothetical protein